MASNRKNNKASQDHKRSLLMASSVIGVCLLLILAIIVVNVARSRSGQPVHSNEISSPEPEESPYNEETFQETFLVNCTISAKAKLNEAAASNYCHCVYDRGVETYGVERFIEVNQEVAKTYDFSELKDLVNECATKVTSG